MEIGYQIRCISENETESRRKIERDGDRQIERERPGKREGGRESSKQKLVKKKKREMIVRGGEGGSKRRKINNSKRRREYGRKTNERNHQNKKTGNIETKGKRVGGETYIISETNCQIRVSKTKSRRERETGRTTRRRRERSKETRVKTEKRGKIDLERGLKERRKRKEY